MPSHYFYNRPKHFTRPVQTTPGDEVEVGAREMIRIFGPEAERVALSQARKFADREDEGGVQVWRNIAAAIGKARPR
ncbi:MAG: hypothetical protein V4559_01790 [Pseudomonadota bacterium]